MNRKGRENDKMDKYSSVTTLEVGLSKQPKDKFEILFRWLAGLMAPLCFFPIFIVFLSGDYSGFRSALFLGGVVGVPFGVFAIRGNSVFAGSRYSNMISPKAIWFAVIFTILFFVILAYWGIFILKH